jgi:mannonate dehydratase
MKLGCQRYGAASDEILRYYARHGVRHISAVPPGAFTAENIREMQKRAEAFGIAVEMGRIHLVSSRFRCNVILDRGEARDRAIAEICDRIKAAGDAAMPGVLYNLSILPFGSPRTDPTPGRGGVRYSTWKLAEASKKAVVPQPIAARTVWEGITYLLERIVPVAEKHKVRLACHPQDPPAPPGFRGVPRVLGTVEGLQRYVSVAESPYHGLNFCQGTACEMLQRPATEIFDVIRWFGTRRKIFNVHFRNLRGRRDDFYEVYPDEGDIDMLQAMRVYKEVGYDGMIMPDHVPTHPDDPQQRQGFAFAYGYIRGLIQAVDASV